MFVLVVHFLLSTVILFVALLPRSFDLYSSRFQPQPVERSACATGVFWIVTIVLKLLLDLMVTSYCANALDSIWEERGADHPLAWLVSAQLVVVFVPAALSVFTSLSFFTNFVVAIVGAVRGLVLLGGFRLFWNRRGVGFTRIPETVSTRVLQMPQDPADFRHTLDVLLPVGPAPYLPP